MRIREIITESDYVNEINMEISNFLAAMRSEGITEIETSSLVSMLVNVGINVDNESILSILSDNPYVKSATPEKVEIKSSNNDVAGQPTDNSAEKVSDMAMKSAAKEIK